MKKFGSGLKLSRSLSAAFCAAFAFVTMALPSHAAVANYFFANPSGFNSMAVGDTKNFNIYGPLGVSARLDFLGSEISLSSGTYNFKRPGTNNPSWMGGSRSMFELNYDGSASGGPKELAKIEFTFSNPLSPDSYLLFLDFDSEEGLAIAAFNASNTLIPYSDFVFARVDGEEPGGALLPTPLWLDQNPTNGWATTDNAGWVGTGAVSGYIVDEDDDSEDNPGVYLQSSQAISRVVFYYNAETDGTSDNGTAFNFATPVPEPTSMSIFAAIVAGGIATSRRKKRS
jgi:hypothetical protein